MSVSTREDCFSAKFATQTIFLFTQVLHEQEPLQLIPLIITAIGCLLMYSRANSEYFEELQAEECLQNLAQLPNNKVVTAVHKLQEQMGQTDAIFGAEH